MTGTVPSRAEVSSKAFLSILTPEDQADNFPELEERLQVSDLECAKEGGNILPTLPNVSPDENANAQERGQVLKLAEGAGRGSKKGWPLLPSHPGCWKVEMDLKISRDFSLSETRRQGGLWKGTEQGMGEEALHGHPSSPSQQTRVLSLRLGALRRAPGCTPEARW